MKFTIEEYITNVKNADFETLVKLRHPTFESFKEYASIGENEFNLIYGTWNDRLQEFKPLPYEQKIALIPYDDIDERLRPLIKRLNDLNLYTCSCCQGIDVITYSEFREYIDNHHAVGAYYPNGEINDCCEWPNGSPHSKYAHVLFEDSLPFGLLDFMELNSDKLRINYSGDRIESTKMKFNSEFHIEFDRILDEWIDYLIE